MKADNEASLRDLLRKAITHSGGVSVHLEDGINSGIPDVAAQRNGTNNTRWIETKHIKAWPARETTGVKLKHFSPSQIAFLMTWRGAWVLMAIGTTHAQLYRGYDFARLYAFGEKPTRAQLNGIAVDETTAVKGKTLSRSDLLLMVHRVFETT